MREAGENPVTWDKQLYPLLYAHEREFRSESGPLAADAAEKVEIRAQEGLPSGNVRVRRPTHAKIEPCALFAQTNRRQIFPTASGKDAPFFLPQQTEPERRLCARMDTQRIHATRSLIDIKEVFPS